MNKPCFNDSTCIAVGGDSFTCQCGNGYSGEVCNVTTTLNLDGNGHWKVDLPRIGTLSYQLSLRFRSTLNGFLLSVKLGTSQSLYVYLKDSEVKMSSGILPLVTITSADSNLLDGSWHNLTIEMNANKVIKARVDHGTWKLLTLTMVSEITEVTVGGGHTHLAANFVGCIQDLTINGKKFVEDQGTKTGMLTFGECTRVPQCDTNTCNKGGDCVDKWVKFSCKCYRQYFGDTCDKGMIFYFYLLFLYMYRYQISVTP